MDDEDDVDKVRARLTASGEEEEPGAGKGCKYRSILNFFLNFFGFRSSCCQGCGHQQSSTQEVGVWCIATVFAST